MDLMLIPLARNDPDTDTVKRMHSEPTVAKYISISDDYFEYVTGSDNVTYYKIKTCGELIGGIHSEIVDTVMYLSICIQPQYREKGFAASALKKFISLIPHTVERIQVSIDETNIPSMRLFESLGFSKAGQEEELIDYILNLRETSAY